MEAFIQENRLGDKYIEALNNRIALSITAVALNELKNPNHGIIGHVKTIRDYLKQDMYRESVKKMDISFMPVKWKLLLICSSKRWAFSVFWAVKIISVIMKSGK